MAEVARAYELDVSQLYAWRRKALSTGAMAPLTVPLGGRTMMESEPAKFTRFEASLSGNSHLRCSNRISARRSRDCPMFSAPLLLKPRRCLVLRQRARRTGLVAGFGLDDGISLVGDHTLVEGPICTQPFDPDLVGSDLVLQLDDNEEFQYSVTNRAIWCPDLLIPALVD